MNYIYLDETNSKLGTELSVQDRKYVLAAYVHRLITNGEKWLSVTRFATTKTGRIHRGIHHCQTSSQNEPQAA